MKNTANGRKLSSKKYQFPNPIHQNYGHVKAIQELLEFLPAEVVQSAVVFTGDAEFKTQMPHGVFYLPQLISHIQQKTTEVMSLNRLQFCVGRIETTRLLISQKTDIEHIQNIKERHRDMT